MGCPTGKVNLFEGDQAVRVGNDEESGFVRVRLSTKPGHLPKVGDEEVVAKDIPWRDDKAALVIGPTGLVLGQNGTLYVGDTLESRIIAIPRAVTRTTALSDRRLTLSSGGRLKQPLGLILAPNGDILTTNAGDGNIVETTPSGHQVATAAGDAKTGAGSLFGPAIALRGKSLLYVDDGPQHPAAPPLKCDGRASEAGPCGVVPEACCASAHRRPPRICLLQLRT